MPSKAIGVGVCPRCGRPGTVVIKAGNYVYVKHGNTWHYIGTIDKVNLNKILTNKPGKTIEWKSSKKHEKRKVIKSLTILSITAIIIFIILGLFYGQFFKIKIYNIKNNTKTNNTFNLSCYKTYNNNDIINLLVCNNTVYRLDNNIKLLNGSNDAFYYNITSTK